MDFKTAMDEVSRVEKNAIEYSPIKPQKEKMERLLEVSPADVHEMEYKDAVNQYYRLEKIITASSRLDMGVGERKATRTLPLPPVEAPSPSLKKKAKKIEEMMKKITQKSAKETKEIEAAAPPEEHLGELNIPGPAERERARAEAAATAHVPIAPEAAEVQETISVPEPVVEEEAEEKPEIKKAQKPLPKKEAAPPKKVAKEEVAEVEEFFEPEPLEVPEPEAVVEAPAEEMPEPLEAPGEISPRVIVPYPPILSQSPLAEADKTLLRLEAQLSSQMTGTKTKKVDTKDTKKRMMELTRELFKERSMDRRAEIKREIVTLKTLLNKAPAKAAAGGLPKGSLFSALRTEQEYELKEAKRKIEGVYKDNQGRLTEAMSAQRALEHRGPAFETFSQNMVELEHKLVELIEKYQTFLTAEHSAELSKLSTRGQSTPESEKVKASLKEQYAHEFASLKESIGEEIHSQLEATRAALFEDAGDPEAVRIAQIANAPEDTLFNLLQAKDSRTYAKYARGEIERSEALLLARKLMAKDAGIDEDTIIKRFGGK